MATLALVLRGSQSCLSHLKAAGQPFSLLLFNVAV
uniref:Uncharacterized protein MANES_01G233400 n=1 Tax=Rhizophora mucronata TaxID=61149 RepID=A0A2P2JEF1_RHIMU